jgi:chloride channel protein, CIC family
LNEARSVPPLGLSLLAILIGVLAGLGAVLLRGLIGIIHNLLFLGILSAKYDANLHTEPSPWGPLVILVPVAGAAGVAYLVQHFAAEAKGHGVPEVMEAIYYQKGKIRPIVALIKALASALSIGSGGAVGREGPIIQIGAAFGSAVAQVLRMPVWQRITMIAAGAAGGIAATFNTPIGGVLFALELILHEISARTLVPVAISTATAAYFGRIFFGDHPSFFIPALETLNFQLTAPSALVSYAGLGIILGGVSTLFIKSIYAFEDFFEEHVSANYYVRHMTGMCLVGALMYVMMLTTGHYYIEGVGYSTIQDVLKGGITSGRFLLLLLALKLVGTSLTLGSGASGGIFSPSLYIGASLGGAYAVLLSNIVPSLRLNPPAFALAGMAGVVGGSTGAAMAGIVMTFEMTLDYNVIIPTTIAVAISYGVRKVLSEDSIYTLKLVRRGHRVPGAFQTNFHHLKPATAIMDTQLGTLPGSATVGEFARIAASPTAPAYFLVVSDGSVVGVVDRGMAVRELQEAEMRTTLQEIAKDNFIAISDASSFFDVLSAVRSTNLPFVLVVGGSSRATAHDVKGVITSRQLVGSIVEDMELFSD